MHAVICSLLAPRGEDLFCCCERHQCSPRGEIPNVGGASYIYFLENTWRGSLRGWRAAAHHTRRRYRTLHSSRILPPPRSKIYTRTTAQRLLRIYADANTTPQEKPLSLSSNQPGRGERVKKTLRTVHTPEGNRRQRGNIFLSKLLVFPPRG